MTKVERLAYIEGEIERCRESAKSCLERREQLRLEAESWDRRIEELKLQKAWLTKAMGELHPPGAKPLLTLVRAVHNVG